MSRMDYRLEILDGQLEAYEPFKRRLIYAIISAGILMMSWMFFISDTLDKLSALKDRTAELETTVERNSPAAYREKIARVNHELAQKNDELERLRQNKIALLEQMSDSQGLLFDNRRYAKMLDILLERSLKLGLEIETMESVDTDKVFYGKVKQLKQLTVTGNGRFPAVAEFLSFAEAQNTLVQVKSVHIRAGEKNPRFTAVILYMGIEI
ncbi:MAG: hypothetical protein AB1763_09895 [Campylobacterota bacterium]